MNNDNQTTIVEPPPVNPFAERAVAQEEVIRKKVSILSTITSRKRRRPVFAVLYGPAGIGKSTLLTGAPKPLFMQIERGLDQITVAKLPVPKTFEEFYVQLNALDKEEHEYESIVIDTGDALELLIWARVCAEGKVKSIEEFGGGYGKGYVRVREIWTGVLRKLTEMSERFNIILICHAHIRSINDPSLSTAFDSWEIKLHQKSAEIVRQMVDLIIFAQMEVTVEKDTPKARKGRGIVSDDRVLWTAPGTGYEAKNRFNLPNPLPFDWEAVQNAINAFYAR